MKHSFNTLFFSSLSGNILQVTYNKHTTFLMVNDRGLYKVTTTDGRYFKEDSLIWNKATHIKMFKQLGGWDEIINTLIDYQYII